MLVVLIAIITIPTIYSGIFLGSMWDPYGEVDHLPVAVVNKDITTTYEGKTVNVGEELVDKLEEDGSLDFHFVDAETAQRGIEDGTYYMVITIPEDFSSNATTVIDSNPKKMELNYTTNPGTNYIASKMSESAINKIRTSVAEQVTQKYAEVVFEKLEEIKDGFDDAVEGTDKMNDGVDKLSDGNSKIKENLETLAESSLTFKNGAETLEVGLKTYTDGVAAVNTGAGQLKDGIDTLAAGTGPLADGANQLADGSSQLKDGTATLKNGTSELATGTSSLKEGSHTLVSGLNTYTNGVGQAFVGSEQLVANNEALNAGVEQLSTGVTSLKGGSEKILAGLEQISDQLGTGLSKQQVALLDQLTAGLEQAKTQMSAADKALQKLDTAALTAQVATLQKGVNSLVTSAETTSNLVNGVSADVDTAVESIKNSAGFSKLSKEEQEEILSAVTGITKTKNYQGAKQYAAGVANGAGELKAGLEQTDLSAVAQVATLKDGIHTLVQQDLFGNSKKAISTQVASLQKIQGALDATEKENGKSGLIEGMKTVNGGLATVQNSVDSTLKPSLQKYTAGVSAVNAGLKQLDDNSAALNGGAKALDDGAQKLQAGANALDTGASALHTGATALEEGISQLSSKVPTLVAGVTKLQAGSTALQEGTKKLVANNSKLMDGIDKLADGSDKISDGASKLADASGTLGAGLVTLKDGTKELHDGLKEGGDKLHDKIDPTTDKTKEMMSAPVEAINKEQTTVDNNGSAMAAYMMSVGLWVGCLAFSIMFSMDKPAGKITSGFSWWLSKASIGGLIAIAQPVVMLYALKAMLGFEPAYFGKTLLVAEFASLAFMSIFFVGNLLLGKVGSFLLLIFMVLQLGGSAGTYPIQLSNGFFQAINPYMPFTHSVNAFRATIANGQSISKALTIFAGIFVVCTAITIAVFEFKARRVKAEEQTVNADVVLE